MRVAIWGVGQLARMLAQAAENLEVECVFVRNAHESEGCVTGLGEVVNLDCHRDDDGQVIISDLYKALGEPDCITVEKEDVPVDLLRSLQAFCQVHPNPDAVEITQHRGREKNLLNRLEIPTTKYFLADEADDLLRGAAKVGYPLFAKSLVNGYDGKNQWFINSDLDLANLQERFPEGGVILEAKVEFEREVSFIGVRDHSGEIRCYPVAENRHDQGLLVSSIAPAQDLSPHMVKQGEQYLTTLLEHWQYVGVLAMECFVTKNELLINELAPRVHNSGHWTMRSGVNSQFENHMRAVSGLPLASTQADGFYGMVNILGYYHFGQQQSLLEAVNGDLHWYQKSPKPRRKLGHINVQSDDYKQLCDTLKTIENSIYTNELDSSGDALAC